MSWEDKIPRQCRLLGNPGNDISNWNVFFKNEDNHSRCHKIIMTGKESNLDTVTKSETVNSCRETMGAWDKGNKRCYGENSTKVMVLHLRKKRNKLVVKHGVYRNGTDQMPGQNGQTESSNMKASCSIDQSE